MRARWFVVAALIPWAIDVMAHPALVTEAKKGFLGRGLLLVFPLVRGLLYWLRYASLSVTKDMAAFNFSDFLRSDRWLGPDYATLQRTIAAGHFTWAGPYCPAQEANTSPEFRARSQAAVSRAASTCMSTVLPLS